MKEFFLKSALYLVIIFALIFLIFSRVDENKMVLFIEPKRDALILGSSRSAQGIIPYIVDSLTEYENFLNFSISIRDTPYGEIYKKAVLKKIDFKSKKAKLFILEINPWSLGIKTDEEKEILRETNAVIAKLNNFNAPHPNIECLIRFNERENYRLLLENKTSERDSNGWLRVDVPMDSISVNKRTKNKIRSYQEQSELWKLSTYRLESFVSLVKELEKEGAVYIVRLPVIKEMVELEASTFPDFNETLLDMVEANRWQYLDLSTYSDSYKYTDGHHLYRESSKQVSRIIGKWIQ